MAAEVLIALASPDKDREGLYTLPILGLPLFLRSVLTLAEGGQTHFVVVAPLQLRRTVIRLWTRYAAGRGLKLDFVPLQGHGGIAACDQALLRQLLADRICLLDGLTVVSPRWIREVLRPGLSYHRPLDDAAPLLPREQVLQALTNGSLVATLDAAAPLARPGLCYRITAPGHVAGLEHFLCELLRMGANGLIARHVNKRLSIPLSRILARWRVSPHAITVVNMLIGLAAGIGTAGVTYFGLLVGGVLFQVASIMDGCDGEVAKLTHRTSRFGQVIDTASDNLALVSFFVGLSIHHFRISGDWRSFLWGATMLGGLGSMLGVLIPFLRRFFDSASLVTFDREYMEPLARRLHPIAGAGLRGIKAIFKKEWFSLCFCCMAIVGVLPLALPIVAIGSWLGVLAALCVPRLAKVRRGLAAATRSATVPELAPEASIGTARAALS